MNKSGFDFTSLQTRGSPLIVFRTQTRQSRKRGDWSKGEGREEGIPLQRYPLSGKKINGLLGTRLAPRRFTRRDKGKDTLTQKVNV